MANDDCIFCKIIDGVIPSEKVYEDDDAVAFLDINPTRPGHTIVVPREHARDFATADPALLSRVIKKVRKVARQVMKGMNADGFMLVTLNGPAAGQEVFHLHFHVIPRKRDDPMRTGWPKVEYKEGEMREIAGRIRAAAER